MFGSNMWMPTSSSSACGISAVALCATTGAIGRSILHHAAGQARAKRQRGEHRAQRRTLENEWGEQR